MLALKSGSAFCQPTVEILQSIFMFIDHVKIRVASGKGGDALFESNNMRNVVAIYALSRSRKALLREVARLFELLG